MASSPARRSSQQSKNCFSARARRSGCCDCECWPEEFDEAMPHALALGGNRRGQRLEARGLSPASIWRTLSVLSSLSIT